MDLEDLQKHLDKAVRQQNSSGVSDFEGYSPDEMNYILYNTFEANSPITFQRLAESDYEQIPILKQIRYFVNLVDEAGEIKLTKKGFLPTKVVADIYNQRILKDDFIESGISKLYNEESSNTVHLTRILSEITGLLKKKKGKLSINKSNKKFLEDDHDLLHLIFSTFATRFNWAYFDGYGQNQIGKLGCGFSLILLSKYGQEQRLDSFYAKKYLNAYPHLTQLEAGMFEDKAIRCYSIRTFDRFLDHFGLIEIEKQKRGSFPKKYIKKTEMLDKLFKFSPPDSHSSS